MYCLTATAKKNNMRLITVVMGEPNSTTRNSETAAMLDYGFNTYKLKLDTIKAPVKIGDKVGKIEVIENDQIIMEITATVDANIKKANIFTIYLRDLKDIISGMI